MDFNMLDLVNHIDKKVGEVKKEIKQDLAIIKADVKSLNQFKWRVTGVAGFVIFLVEIARIVVEYLQEKGSV